MCKCCIFWRYLVNLKKKTLMGNHQWEQVRMAERSKALRSGRSPVLWTWVRIPLLTTHFASTLYPISFSFLHLLSPSNIYMFTIHIYYIHVYYVYIYISISIYCVYIYYAIRNTHHPSINHRLLPLLLKLPLHHATTLAYHSMVYNRLAQCSFGRNSFLCSSAFWAKENLDSYCDHVHNAFASMNTRNAARQERTWNNWTFSTKYGAALKQSKARNRFFSSAKNIAMTQCSLLRNRHVLAIWIVRYH